MLTATAAWLTALVLALLVATASAVAGTAAPDSLPAVKGAVLVAPHKPAFPAVKSAHVHNAIRRPASVLAIGGLLAILADGHENPENAHERLARPGWETVADVGNVYGDGLVIGGASAGLCAAGHLAGDEQVIAIGNDLTEAFLVGSSAAWTLKLAVNRKRPSGGPHSFPSGHTTSAFAVVPVIAHHLGWKAAVPAAVLATATGMGRIEARRHYLSDVLAGAALGLACGDLVAGKGLLPGHARLVAGRDGVGLSVPF